MLAGRIVRSKVGNLDMFYFPRRQFHREKGTKNIIEGIANKDCNNVKHLTDMEDGFGAEWDPSSLIPSGLEKAGLGDMMAVVGAPSGSASGSGGGLPALPMPGPAGSLSS